MSSLSPVTFHGDIIFVIPHDGEPLAPMKPIVENMGLAWQTQQRKLTDNNERWGITMMVIPSEGGGQQTLCMPVRKLPAFMASINPKKVRPELREKIELYQAECDDALWNDWTKGVATRKPPLLTPFLQVKVLPRARREQLAELLLAKLTHVPAALAWKSTWTAFNRNFSIPQHRLLPESRMDEAVAFLSALTIGPTGKVVHKNRQASLPTDDMRQVASALTHLIAQAKTLLPLLQTATPEVCA